MPNLKEQLLQRLQALGTKARKGDVGRKIIDEFNLVLVLANDQLNLDLRHLSVRPEELVFPSGLRHADDPISHRALSAEELEKCLMDGNTFRTRLANAFTLLDAHDPPNKGPMDSCVDEVPNAPRIVKCLLVNMRYSRSEIPARTTPIFHRPPNKALQLPAR